MSSNMKKNRHDHRGAPGNWSTAEGYARKAKPGPESNIFDYIIRKRIWLGKSNSQIGRHKFVFFFTVIIHLSKHIISYESSMTTGFSFSRAVGSHFFITNFS